VRRLTHTLIHSGMINNRLARPAVALFALATIGTIGACSKGSSSTPSPAPTPASSSAGARPAAPAARPFTAAMVAQGDSLFHSRSCRNCHGADAHGAANGPNLTTGKFMHVDGSYAGFVRIITSGVPADSIQDKSHRFAMAPRGGARPAPLTDDEIKSIAAYVYSLNHP
jgi:mono/diheme cytochrome c family protein